ncbi:MAG: helicase-related protein, partial [Acidimicrobiia bacterium]
LARYLGGRAADGSSRPVAIVDAGTRKQLDVEIVVPVEDMGELGKPLMPASPADNESLIMSGAAAGDPVVRSSIWPSIDESLLALIRSHRSTLVFVNSRRLAERLAARLNELAGEELVRSHHGSIAREQRLEIEDALKAGQLPALVATSSLELGIDMGAVDLVVQVEAPSSVASGLQRIGRAGHRVGEPSKGRIFPKFRHDLLIAAVVSMRMQAGEIEQTVVPKNPIDVLAQQIVAMAAVETLTVNEIRGVVAGSENFAELSADVLTEVLDMLAGRYPSDEFAELRPRINWDRIEDKITARSGARMLAVTSGGTIPDRGLFGAFTPDGSRVGELDEEFVYESRVGETMLLGATTWRIEEITRDRVVVTPAPGEPGKMPFWHDDAPGRPYELGQAVGAFLRQVDDLSDDDLAETTGMDALAVKNLRAYISEEREATGGALPTDRQIVVQRFQDELGDWRVCILTPFGSRVHAPWALAIEEMLRRRSSVDVDAIWSDDGIVFRLPEAEEAPDTDWMLLEPEDLHDLVVEAAGQSAMFAARFRENAARALLLPRRRPGTRTPLWQMRQRAADLLAVASQYGSFPIILETYREVLQDVFDLPALTQLLGDIRARKVRVVSVDTRSPSPFASSLAFAYVANFMYDYDAPLAERRAQALTLDRRMLAELIGTGELRELIDADVLAELELELQGLTDRRRAKDVDGAADTLRRLGDLTAEELRARCGEGVASDVADVLVATRRAVLVRVAGEPRLIAPEDAGRYRDALGVSPPPGVPEAFLVSEPDALVQLVRRWARNHGPFVVGEPAARFGLPVELAEAVLVRLENDGRLERGEFRPGGSGTEWIDVEVLRTLRQRSLAALRKEVEPTEADALARFLPVWQGIGSDARGIDRLYEVISQLQGVAIPASVLERDVLPARVRDYLPRLLDDLAAAGEVQWVGAGPLGRNDGRVALYLRGATIAAAAPLGERPEGELHDALLSTLAERGACFFRELGVAGINDRELLDALWDLVWSGEVTNDSFAPLRSTVAGTSRKSRRPAAGNGRPRLGRLTALGPPTAQGRWSLVQRADVASTELATATAQTLLERHGVLTREAVRGEGVPGGFAAVYPVLKAMEEAGKVRRGYFVTGLGGAQFALPGAVDRLRAFREGTPSGLQEVLLLAATDPALAYGLSIAWPEVGEARPMRVAGAYVVMIDGLPSLYVERRAKGILALRAFDGTWEDRAANALDDLLASGRFNRMTFERWPEDLEVHLKERGFLPTPKGLTRYA